MENGMIDHEIHRDVFQHVQNPGLPARFPDNDRYREEHGENYYAGSAAFQARKGMTDRNLQMRLRSRNAHRKRLKATQSFGTARDDQSMGSDFIRILSRSG